MSLSESNSPRKRSFLGFLLSLLRHSWLLALIAVILTSSVLYTFWNVFFHHVPSGHMLIVVSKFGQPLSEGEVLAKPGQRGIQYEVLGEGWHFIWPILYTVEIKPNVVVPGMKLTTTGVQPPKVGILKALGGDPLPPGQFLAKPGQRGIRREVLLPGSYRLNPYGYEIKLVDMVEIKQGYIGVKRRKLGDDGRTAFATQATEKGIIKDDILQPGLYPINTEEYEVIPCEVGIYQTSYHYSEVENENTALVFDASDSNRIQLDCTIEWELKPEFWPEWLAKFRNRERIEATVIKPNVKNISRNKGQNYGAEDFLDGTKREKFQNEFTRELSEACQEDDILIRHAFIRNIIIPDAFLKPKRDEQLAREKTITQKEQRLTAESNNEVVSAQQTVKLEVAKVHATTEKLVTAIEQESTNVDIITQAKIEQMKDEFGAKKAILDAQSAELLGVANADAEKLVNSAKSSLYKQKLDLFGREGDSYLRYVLAQSLNPEMRLRLFQSGPGTFWTNMGNKDMNMFLPIPTGEGKK
jgi:hypothetical protein